MAGRFPGMLLWCGALLLPAVASWNHATADESATEILERVSDKYEEINDAEISFTQEVTFTRTNLHQTTTGKLRLRKKDKYRLETNDRVVVTDGATVWSHSFLSGQVIIDNFRVDDRTISPEKILTGAPDDFAATVVGKSTVDKDELIILKLIPREESSAITSLKLWIDESSWLIRRAEVSEFSGKTTEYHIDALKINIGLDDELFRYAIPEGVEVVDLR